MKKTVGSEVRDSRKTTSPACAPLSRMSPPTLMTDRSFIVEDGPPSTEIKKNSQTKSIVNMARLLAEFHFMNEKTMSLTIGYPFVFLLICECFLPPSPAKKSKVRKIFMKGFLIKMKKLSETRGEHLSL